VTLTARPSGQPAQDGHRDFHVVSPAPRDLWHELLSADPGAMPTQTPEWTDWVCRTRGRTDASRLYEFPGGRRLLLPLLAQGPRWSEESMPYGFGYGGPLVAGGRATPEDARAVLDDLARRPVVRASLVPAPQSAATWTEAAPPVAVTVPYLAHVLDLEGGWGSVWSDRFRPRIRRDVRKAEKQGLEIRTGPDSGVLEAYGELSRRSAERWARERRQPLWLVRQVERQRDRVGRLASAIADLGPMVRLWTTWLDGDPAAVNVVLRHGNQAYGWLSVMDKELAQRTLAGTLLQSLVIEDACAGGARWFQLGESDPGSGVAAYKERFGGVPVPWSAVHFERLPVMAGGRRLRGLVNQLAATVPTRTDGGAR
jgi:CelD/BcsL family acetyltransferase involved in cellulose biosynthesis